MSGFRWIVLALIAVPAICAAQVAADQPVPRSDRNSQIAHEQLLDKARRGGIDLYFEGDSIVRRWGATDYPELLSNWTRNFFGWNAANFGWGADTTQNILWRLHNGELDDVHPKVIVLLAGTNNIGNTVRPDRASDNDVGIDRAKVDDVTRGITAIVDLMRVKAPRATVIVTAIFPRNDNMAVMPTIDAINRGLAALANGSSVRFLDVNGALADRDGRLVDGVMNARDRLHPTVAGYQIWADALRPLLVELLGQPGRDDHAPPPTGDPSAQR